MEHVFGAKMGGRHPRSPPIGITNLPLEPHTVTVVYTNLINTCLQVDEGSIKVIHRPFVVFLYPLPIFDSNPRSDVLLCYRLNFVQYVKALKRIR